MEQKIRKFLEFNGKIIYFLAVNGTYWIAIKPICEALGVDYVNQFKSAQKDEILSGALSKHTMHDASGRLQKMACIDEKFVYGWLFSLRSKNPEFIEYKRKCYELLYEFFHGTVGNRKDIIGERTRLQLSLENAVAELSENEHYQKAKQLEGQIKEVNKKLKLLDQAIADEQLDLFQS